MPSDNIPLAHRLASNFERFNSYAAKAITFIAEEESQTYATLALAFEISQLRYQLAKRPSPIFPHSEVT